MNRKINNRTVENTEGFIVKVIGIHEVEYIDNEKKMIIEIEGGSNPDGSSEWSLYLQTIRWQYLPGKKERFPIENQDEILKKVVECLKLLGMKVIIE